MRASPPDLVRRFSIRRWRFLANAGFRSLISIGWSHLNRKEFRHDRATPKNDRGTAVTQLRAQHEHGLYPLRRAIRPTLTTLPGWAGTGTDPAIPAVPASEQKSLVAVVQSSSVRAALFV